MNKAKTSRVSKPAKPLVNSNNANGTISPKEQLFEIRDLLFGEQVSSIQQTIAQQNQATNNRLDELEKLIQKNHADTSKQISLLSQKLADDLESNRLEHVSQEGILEEKLESLNGQLDNYQQQTEKEFKSTQQQISQSNAELNQSLKVEVDKLEKQIIKVSSELGTNKADRKTLASLLESMATNLTES
jgi:uncharacterized protein YdhG (YjbR/CyaY superfamily)